MAISARDRKRAQRERERARGLVELRKVMTAKQKIYWLRQMRKKGL
jgi:hypothetical protein